MNLVTFSFNYGHLRTIVQNLQNRFQYSCMYGHGHKVLLVRLQWSTNDTRNDVEVFKADKKLNKWCSLCQQQQQQQHISSLTKQGFEFSFVAIYFILMENNIVVMAS